MKGTAITIALLAAAAIAAKPAAAGPPFPERCCACLASDARTSGSATFALACATIVTPPELTAFEAQCSFLGGNPQCFIEFAMADPQGADNLDCPGIFASENIICPQPVPTAPVPALGPGMLVGLALGLCGLGAFATRRRARR